MITLAVLAGGMMGAPARYLVDRAIAARTTPSFPGARWPSTWLGRWSSASCWGHSATGPATRSIRLLGTGLCGGLTTFSTFSYETLWLLEDGSVSEAGLNVIGSLAAAVLLALLGYLLAGALLPASPGLAGQRPPVEWVAVTAARTHAPVCQTA